MIAALESSWIWSTDGWVLLVGVLSACSCALLGNYLVLRKMSLMGDAISHAVLPGLAIAFLITHSRASLPMLIGAIAVGLLTALLTQMVTRYGKVEEGASMGVIFTVLFAIGLILIEKGARHVDLDAGCVLYGNMDFIGLEVLDGSIPTTAITLSIVLAANLLFVGLFYKELKISAFDPALATTLGINANVMHYALMAMVAVTTVANFEAVGSVLVIAMLIVPPVTAHLLTDRLGVMIPLSLLLAAVSAAAARVLVVYAPQLTGLDVTPNTAAMMATLSGALLLVALIGSPRLGLLSRWRNRAALSLQIAREDMLGLLYRAQEEHPRQPEISRTRLLTLLGGGWRSRLALAKLRREGAIDVARTDGGATDAVRLTPIGQSRAAGLIRSHRLWESYLDRHFDLPLDHLHMPAERVEHYISPQMRSQLETDLEDLQRDPHGKRIPEPKTGGESAKPDA